MIANSSKYKLIVHHVITGISNGNYCKGSWLPSINDFMKRYKMSRDTVFTGLSELKSKGIIESKPGLGYFVSSVTVSHEEKIFLLFNEFNSFKEELYNSFMHYIDPSSKVGLFFHNYNREVFDKLINEANGKYTSYIIMSGKFEGIESVLKKLNGKVYLLDHFHPELYGKYSAVFQNFEKDTYEGLVFAQEHIKKYREIIMMQKDEKEPYERYYGLKKFSEEYGYSFKYINSIKDQTISKGELYIVVNDLDIVEVIKKIEKKKLTLGKDVGILSYNETPLKEVVASGITTLSTNFKMMGKTISELMKEKTIRAIENPWKLTVRKSL